MKYGLAAAIAAAAVMVAPALARAAPERFALVIGNNTGDGDDVELVYAEQDARRIAGVLTLAGGFAPENVIEVTDGRADDVLASLRRLKRKVAATRDDTVLFVYYSGHGDAENLHLSGSRLPLSELVDSITGARATVRVLVVDACRSGGATRVKGGSPGPTFQIAHDQRLEADGLAILTSSAAGEDSQESDELQASFFTHFLASGLLGAGDSDNDGTVTLAESFRYAASRTVAATAGTLAGPQHPTYRFDLGGRGDLVLTRLTDLGSSHGQLRLPDDGAYLIARGGAAVAELSSTNRSRTLVLRAGSYTVTRRTRSGSSQGSIEVPAGGTRIVRSEELRSLPRARLVRKGSTERPALWAIGLTGGARGQVLDLGNQLSAGLRVRHDRRSFALEAAITAGQSRRDNDSLSVATREVNFSLGAHRVFDFEHLSVSGGVEAGLGVWRQSLSDSTTRTTAVYFFSPVVALERHLGASWAIGARAGLPTYLVPAPGEQQNGLDTTTTWTTALTVTRAF